MAAWSPMLLPDIPAETKPLRLHFEASAGETVRAFLLEHPALFVEESAAASDLIIFGSDEIDYVRHSRLHREFPAKSFCITETDIPTFRLPGLYAANSTGWLNRGRTRTMNYFISMLDKPNLEVRERIGLTHEKRYLYSFMGGTNSWTRRKVFRSLPSREDTLIEPTDAYNHWDANRNPGEKISRRQRYAEVMATSKYVLCPRGCGSSSYRLFESMSLGVAPVILSDKWKPVEGVDWSFALFIPERQISQLDGILRQHESEWEQRGSQAAKTFGAFFALPAIGWTLHQQMSALIGTRNTSREAVMAVVAHTRASARQVYWDGYRVAKRVVLQACSRAGIAVPVQLNRPVEEQLKPSESA